MKWKLLTIAAISALSACSKPASVKTGELTLGNEAQHEYQAIDATSFSKAQQQKVLAQLPIGDFKDGTMMASHSNAVQVAPLPNEIIAMGKGSIDFVENTRPNEINPSLFNYMKFEHRDSGLFKLNEEVYQIRGDLADVTLVRGTKGWIIIDAGVSVDFTENAWEFAKQHLPGGATVPISTIIYSHSHIDHFGGVKGFVNQAQVDSGEVTVIAPYGFMEEVLAENVIAGSAMQRRAHYSFGFTLDTKENGKERFYFPLINGKYSLIAPTQILPQGKGLLTKLIVDGLEIEFKDISGAEAPASTMLFIPKHNMIYNSELMYRGLHNVYALRGARVRDALAWSKLINNVLLDWGQTAEMMTGPHGPTFNGNSKIKEFMSLQRDNYGFIHNQTVRLINSGMKLQDVGDEVASLVPKSLSQVWHTRGFHGSYSHNARGVADRYLGFYDGNPAHLNPLPSKQEAQVFVRYMGGTEKILANASQDYQQGNYRAITDILNKVLLVEPDNWPARHLQANAFEQLAFQAENPQWRNAYLAGAKELRLGEIQIPEMTIAIDDLLQAATIENLLDAVAVKVNAAEAQEEQLTFNIVVKDDDEIYFVELANANLSYGLVAHPKVADLTLTINRQDLLDIFAGKLSKMEILNFGVDAVEGSPWPLIKLIGLINKDNKFYPLVPMPE